MTLRIVQDEVCDEILSTDPFALPCGMVLHEKFPPELAFAGPAKVLQRFGTLDPAKIAAADPRDFAALCTVKPAIHRRPDVMAARIQELARHIEERYGGDTASVWCTAGTADLLYSRLMLLPGFSPRRCKVFIALLGKQLGVRPAGWSQVAGDYAANDRVRSIADVTDPFSLEQLKAARPERRKRSRRAGRLRSGGGRRRARAGRRHGPRSAAPGFP